MNRGDRLDVVLDVFVEDDAYRVVMGGVYQPGQPVPPVPDGATRNLVQTWLEVPHTVRAFALGRTTSDQPTVVDQAAAAVVADAIRSFPFDNFGMDDVSFALEDDPDAQEWVAALADVVLRRLTADPQGKPC